METVISSLTVFFEDPFWVGVYERQYDGYYEVCKFTFGAEPKEGEIYAYLLENYGRLVFSQSKAQPCKTAKAANPKRMRRAAARQTIEKGVGTKAQQALKLQYEQGKLLRKGRNKDEREAEKENRFKLNRLKRKQKHKGY